MGVDERNVDDPAVADEHLVVVDLVALVDQLDVWQVCRDESLSPVSSQQQLGPLDRVQSGASYTVCLSLWLSN